MKKLFIVILLLFIVSLLDFLNIYSYDKLRNYIDDNINFQVILNKFIGSAEKDKADEIVGGIIYQSPCYEEEVISLKDGVVVKIYLDDTYTVTVLSANGVMIEYSNLSQVDKYIYEKVEEGEIIGSSRGYYEIK